MFFLGGCDMMGQFTVASPTTSNIISSRQAELYALERPAAQTAADIDQPWYKTPVESITRWFGNTTVDTGNVAVQTQDGKLTIMPSEQLYKQQAASNAKNFFQSIPLPVWVAVGGLGLVLLLRK